MSEFIVSLFALVVLLAILTAYITAPTGDAFPRHFGAWLAVLVFACVVFGLVYRVVTLGWALL
jgi:hypothetical protein